jgi:hypothetical protein
LDEHAVLAFLEGRLPAETRSETEAHLQSCKACSELTTWAAADLANRSCVIEPGDQGSVFFDVASGKPLSPRDAEDTFGLDPGRGRNIVETDVPASWVNREWNKGKRVWELRVRGTVPLVNPRFIRR